MYLPFSSGDSGDSVQSCSLHIGGGLKLGGIFVECFEIHVLCISY